MVLKIKVGVGIIFCKQNQTKAVMNYFTLHKDFGFCLGEGVTLILDCLVTVNCLLPELHTLISYNADVGHLHTHNNHLLKLCCKVVDFEAPPLFP